MLLPGLAFAAPQATDTPAASAPAKVDEDISTDEAQRHFKNGLELFKLHSLDASLAEFERAYQLTHNYKILFNIALVYRDMNDFAGAVDTFDRYFAEGGADVDPQRRAEVQAEYNRIKVYVAYLQVKTSLPNAEVFVDDVPVGRTPFAKPVTINVGTRRKISVNHEDAAPITRFVKASAGETVKLDVDLRRNEVSTGPQIVSRTVVVREQEKPSKFTTLSWVGLGAAGALALGATATGIAALGASSSAENESYTANQGAAEVDSRRSTARALGITTDVLIVAAAATAGVTLYLTLSRDPKPAASPSASMGLRFTGTGGALVGSF